MNRTLSPMLPDSPLAGLAAMSVHVLAANGERAPQPLVKKVPDVGSGNSGSAPLPPQKDEVGDADVRPGATWVLVRKRT